MMETQIGKQDQSAPQKEEFVKAPRADPQKFVEGMTSLPSLPSLYLQLTEELRASEVSIGRISRVISKDLAMTSKILQIVNSAYFGLSRQISSVERAILLIGLEMLRTFVLSVEVFSMFEPRKMAGLAVAGLWRHSMNTAGLARKIAVSSGLNRDLVEHISTAAFLHDIGKLLMANERPDHYRQASDLAVRMNVPLFEAEMDVFGFNHAEAGGCLLNRWKLPDIVVHAVQWHHAPAESGERGLSPAAVLHATNYLEHEQSDVAFPMDSGFQEAYILSLCSKETLTRWRELATTD